MKKSKGEWYKVKFHYRTHEGVVIYSYELTLWDDLARVVSHFQRLGIYDGYEKVE